MQNLPWTFTGRFKASSQIPTHRFIFVHAAVMSSSQSRFSVVASIPPQTNSQTPSPYKANVRWEKKKKRQWTSDLSLRRQGKRCSLGATRVHRPLCHSSPQCLTLPSHKTPVKKKKTSCSHFYRCQMVGRPPCLWTCLPSLVKPVDLGNIKTAVYEKAWNKTHKHPAAETIPTPISSPKEPFSFFYKICEPWLRAGEAQMQLLDLWVHFLIFSLLIIICKPWARSSSNVSPRSGEAKTHRPDSGQSWTAVWACDPQRSDAATSNKHSEDPSTSATKERKVSFSAPLTLLHQTHGEIFLFFTKLWAELKSFHLLVTCVGFVPFGRLVQAEPSVLKASRVRWESRSKDRRIFSLEKSCGNQ